MFFFYNNNDDNIRAFLIGEQRTNKNKTKSWKLVVSVSVSSIPFGGSSPPKIDL